MQSKNEDPDEKKKLIKQGSKLVDDGDNSVLTKKQTLDWLMINKEKNNISATKSVPPSNINTPIVKLI